MVGLEHGVDDYVVKPFSPRELAARVKEILRLIPDEGRPQPEGDPPAFQIDEQRRQISYFGEVLDLTRY